MELNHVDVSVQAQDDFQGRVDFVHVVFSQLLQVFELIAGENLVLAGRIVSADFSDQVESLDED